MANLCASLEGNLFAHQPKLLQLILPATKKDFDNLWLLRMTSLRHLPRSCTIEKKDFVLSLDNRSREIKLLITETYNRKGYIAEIYRVDDRGRKCFILVPEGTEKPGWTHFVSLLHDKKEGSTKVNYTTLLVDKKKKNIYSSSDSDYDNKRRSYAEAVIKGSSSVEDVLNWSTNANMGEKKKTRKGLAEIDIDWNKTVVLTRRYFHENWKKIVEKLKDQLDISVHGIPLHAWNLESFIQIGDACGGFIDVARETREFTDLLEASIRIKDNYSGFILAFIKLFDKKGQSFIIQVIAQAEGK
ncbi:cleavage and polyadenylation specificity factor subunit 1 [Cucumis melo var. makuwa]|uniref:Cleavage and polyadenylation specificity factor subunit 1 n=1 Tax=Cucumis melo var. makuwa TaxID=1194695 RepID=A0A5A7UMX4_CUCMM|nr:cleavage and polyadenylation specificity factor subunit 1 [Cucumis melo var. makuwa]TYK10920.1 cleavage and polyadenylation specificity factor subunit 1 [Cucumis melo var. makuwa]